MTGYVTYVQNGEAFGPDGAILNTARIGHRFVPQLLQPWLDDKGRACVTLPTGHPKKDASGKVVMNRFGQAEQDTQDFFCSDLEKMGIRTPVFNAAFLRKDEWIYLQSRVIASTRLRLRAWADLAAANPISGFDGMGKYTIEYEMASDPGEAIRNMEIIGELRHDEAQFAIGSLPLPITQSGFHYTQRRMAVGSNAGMPPQTRSAEAAGRRVAESIEKVTIGVEAGITWGTRSTGVNAHVGTSTEYGYTNFPYRITKTDLHTPTSANPENVVEDIIEMRELMYTNGFYGPFVVYHSTGYDRFLDDDYFRTGGTAVSRTLRDRVEGIEGIIAVRRLDYLTSGYQLVMVQMTPDVAEAVIGMNVTTVQWPELGGAIQKFRVMMMGSPLLHRNYAGVTGVVHGTTS